MAAAGRPATFGLALITVALGALALVPEFYHRWWWWDVLMHGLIAGLFAVWGRLLRVAPRWAWPAFVAGMIAWEWLELATPLLFSPSRQDVLKDLTVNVVAFGTTWIVLARGAITTERLGVSLPRFDS